jgi:DNA-binding MarR family transcriptional regulator
MDQHQLTTRSGLRQYGVLVWLRLARLFQRIDARSAHFFHEEGLNTAQFDVLAKIGATSGLTQQELANALLVTKGNISQLLGKMEQKGLITRRQEGRANCLFLTPRGQELFEQVVPRQEALIATLLSPLAPDEQRELLRLLRKLDQQMPA